MDMGSCVYSPAPDGRIPDWFLFGGFFRRECNSVSEFKKHFSQARGFQDDWDEVHIPGGISIEEFLYRVFAFPCEDIQPINCIVIPGGDPLIIELLYANASLLFLLEASYHEVISPGTGTYVEYIRLERFISI